MAELKMPNINQVALSGRLSNDPQYKILDGGRSLVTFNLAVNRNYRDRDGEWQQDTSFIPISVRDRLAETFGKQLKKGSAIFLTGRLRSRLFQAEGRCRSVLEVVPRNIQLLDEKEKEEMEEI